MIIREILALIAFLVGTFFGIFGMVGLFRFRDPYSRLHAGSLCGTTAVFSYLIALLLLAPSSRAGQGSSLFWYFSSFQLPLGPQL